MVRVKNFGSHVLKVAYITLVLGRTVTFTDPQDSTKFLQVNNNWQ